MTHFHTSPASQPRFSRDSGSVSLHLSPYLSPSMDPSFEPFPESSQILNDRYRIIQVLGRGGFGVSALAKDYQLPSHPYCVIKQLCPLSQAPDALERARWRFQREAKTLAQLGSHAQIPLLLNYFEKQGRFFLVQEFIPGKTLTQLVKEGMPWKESQVIEFLEAILPVIGYVHRQGVIHRDIKPSNIIRCQSDDRFVLLDFGAVKSVLTSEETTSHSTVQFVGTNGFAPVEQRQLRPCFASDLYALGMTSLFLLTGQWPQAFPFDRISQKVQWEKFVTVSKPMSVLLTHLLHPDLAQRYRSAEDVLKAIQIMQALQHKTQNNTQNKNQNKTRGNDRLPDSRSQEKYVDLKDCLHTQSPKRRFGSRSLWEK